jgi:DNA-binding GntR family transcriptional regulator
MKNGEPPGASNARLEVMMVDIGRDTLGIASGKPRKLAVPKAGDALPNSATDIAYAGIVDLILTRDLRPGEKTSVQLLAARLGLGRMPVKEAMNRLQTEGVLSIKGRSGTTVAEIDAVGARHMFALRRTLEDMAAEAAAESATAEDFDTVAALLHEMRVSSIDAPHSKGAGASFVKANSAFHAAIVAAAHNPYLDQAYARLQLQFQIVSYLSQRGYDALAAARRQSEHEEILTALMARDAEALKENLRRHSATTEQSLLRYFS